MNEGESINKLFPDFKKKKDKNFMDSFAYILIAKIGISYTDYKLMPFTFGLMLMNKYIEEQNALNKK